jgi:ankyrin repeat protein
MKLTILTYFLTEEQDEFEDKKIKAKEELDKIKSEKTEALEEIEELKNKVQEMEDRNKFFKYLLGAIVIFSITVTCVAPVLVHFLGNDPNCLASPTSLFRAAAEGHESECRILLRGVDANIQDKVGWTPLHFAAQNGHESVCRLLLRVQTLHQPIMMF